MALRLWSRASDPVWRLMYFHACRAPLAHSLPRTRAGSLRLLLAPRVYQSSFSTCSGLHTDAEAVKVVPKMQISFTCKVCDGRSTHQMTKQAYEKGTILIQCPSCKSRHLIADNLKIFEDSRTNIEDILKAQGQKVQRGVLADGDVEIMPDDTKGH